MKKTLTIIMLFGVMCGYAQNTPPHAASNKTWTFGNQTWSDAIHIPKCKKAGFIQSLTEPECRSYTENGKTMYYYNWSYVYANKNTMCPSPWRVPTKSDFGILAKNTTYSALISAWGYGGHCSSSGALYGQGSLACYWSSTEYSSGSTGAYYLDYDSSGVYPQNLTNKNLGFQVRCVK
jgi:hypothetical protein